MLKTINWLEKHRLITLMLAVAFFFAVVVFHDEVTVLAVKLRRTMTLDGYNLFFTLAALVLFIPWFWLLARNIWKQGRWREALVFLLPTLLLIVLFFLFMLTYTIEAVHFFQYAILAFLLFPLLRSYGGAVFWTTLLGILDELYQYIILTPTFPYFDFNDILLNLLGAGLGVITIRLVTGAGISPVERSRSLKAAAMALILISISYLSAYLGGYIDWYPAAEGETVKWFTVNRGFPPGSFWTQAYAGKYFHIIGPWEGTFVSVILFSGYFLLDWLPAGHFPRRK